MSIIKSLNAKDFKTMIISAANNLSNNRQLVDELNVFPVPDGDTGTNMSKTIMSAAAALEGKEFANVLEVANAVSSATLRGARGNSGVILSQILRGFAKGISEEPDALTIAAALKESTSTAYRAVMKPTEGTILTVIRKISEEAAEKVTEETDVIALFEMIMEWGNKALDKTPDLLPALKRAGVVDSGGKGLMIIFEGMLYAIKNGKAIELSDKSMALTPAKTVSVAGGDDIEFGYCTEFIIKKNKTADAEKLRSAIEKKGDSLVLVDGGDIIKVHIHSNHPGEILENALLMGDLSDIKVDNMREQHTNKFEQEKTEEYAILAVAAGDGVCALFKDLGANDIINGGQTMNPSSEDILSKVKMLSAKTVFVLPNNKNIILAAQQAAKISPESNIIVIETKSIPEGMSALLAFDPTLSAEDNEREMTQRAKEVKTGMITYAVRDSVTDSGEEIKKGDYMGILGGKITDTGAERSEVAKGLCSRMLQDECYAMTVIYGDDVTEEEAEELCSQLEEAFPDAEVTPYPGEQPVYSYIISAE